LTARDRAVLDSDRSPATPLSQGAPYGPEALRPHLAMGLPFLNLSHGYAPDQLSAVGDNRSVRSARKSSRSVSRATIAIVGKSLADRRSDE
jgi:hypothetical protein